MKFMPACDLRRTSTRMSGAMIIQISIGETRAGSSPVDRDRFDDLLWSSSHAVVPERLRGLIRIYLSSFFWRFLYTLDERKSPTKLLVVANVGRNGKAISRTGQNDPPSARGMLDLVID
jgi:hypothetical protein